MNLNELLSYQKRVCAIMDRAEPIFSSANPDIAQLENCRQQVTAALTTYQLYKHRELFPRLKASGFRAVTDTGYDLQAECITLGNDFRAHAARWKDRDVLTDWDSYARMALGLIARTRRQLAREATEAQRLAWLSAHPTQRPGMGFGLAALRPCAA
jgi:hypothetical protein